jgi:hypothetical protein
VDAIVPVMAYAGIGYVLVFVISTLRHQTLALLRRASSYTQVYDYAESMQSRLVRQQLNHRRLSDAVVFLIENVGEAVFEIRDVSSRDSSIDLLLAPNGVVTPRSGQLLFIIDRRDGAPLGYLRVTSVSSVAIRASLEDPEPLWLGTIRNTLSLRVPFQTTAIAILTEIPATEETP